MRMWNGIWLQPAAENDSRQGAEKQRSKGDVEAVDFGTAQSVQADMILTNNEFASQLQGGKAFVKAIMNMASEQEVESAIDEFLSQK
jgi:ascorbate PTS system EIIB component